MKWSSIKSYKAKISFLVPVFLVIILAATLLPACAAPREEVRLTLVSGWPVGVAFNDKLVEFVDRVNEEGEGKVFIDFLGGPEVAPLTEAVGMVRDGVYDMCLNTPGYYAGLCPDAVPLYYAPPDPVLLREIGVTDLADQFLREKAGVSLVGFIVRGEPFTIISKEPITSADFSGLLMHSVPVYTASLTYLGASTTALSTPEFYVALQTGVVDAVPCPIATVPYEYKLFEVAKYIVHPPMPVVTSGELLVNAERWDGLPKDVRDLMIDKMVETEAEVLEFWEARTSSYVDKLVAEGMEIVELPPAEADKYYYAFTDYAWEQYMEKMPVWVPQLYELCKPYLEY